MEHIFNIAISVDDEAIQKQAVDYCQKKLYEDIKKAITGRYYSSDMNIALREIVNNNVKDFLEAHKEEIVDGAISSIGDRLMRSKLVKEHITELLQNIGSNV